jgi:predicted ABC-type transport system involved in lysophospholipase L1 biosynthesis ATPase subunit
MSSLLSIERIDKAYVNGAKELVVLDGVSFDIARIGLYGPARSGKSTLLRIAVGIERPDGGSVRFEGRELTRMRAGARARLLRRSIGYLVMSDWRPNPGEDVLNHVVTALGSDGFTPPEARRKAARALELVELSGGAVPRSIASLSVDDRARVALARTIVREPRLLVVDEPATMPSLRERDRFCALLSSLARERSMALLSASAEMAALQGVDVLMSISGGGVRSSASRRDATVVQLATRRPLRPSDGPDASGAVRPTG